jgi:prepilin-type processing-associated H-X9-DG protein
VLYQANASKNPLRHGYGGNALFLDGRAGRVTPAGLMAGGIDYSIRSKLNYNY